MPDPEFCQVMTTVDSQDAADALARSVVTARLAACAQVIGPVSSTYRWNNGIEQAREWLVLCKTTRSGYPGLAALIRSQHPYDVPEILCIPVTDGDPAYLSWIRAGTTAAPG